MDTTKPPVFSCSPAELSALQLLVEAPLLVDVRKNAAYQDATFTLPGALYRDPLHIATWATALPPSHQVIVACVHGHEVSQGAMATLRGLGINALFLQGGVQAWREQGYPVTPKNVAGPCGKHTGDAL